MSPWTGGEADWTGHKAEEQWHTGKGGADTGALNVCFNLALEVLKIKMSSGRLLITDRLFHRPLNMTKRLGTNTFGLAVGQRGPEWDRCAAAFPQTHGVEGRETGKVMGADSSI